MKLAFFLLTVLSAVLVNGEDLKEPSFYKDKFLQWVTTHGILAKSDEHFQRMLQNYAFNDAYIEKHNAGNHTFKLGHNQFSHMSSDEWKAYVKIGLTSKPAFKGAFLHKAPEDSSVPASIDWVTKGGVTAVKDQGQCGSCWSFSTTGALEGAYFAKYGKLNSYSEQHLIDCDNPKNNENRGSDLGCNGGLMDNAFEWLKNNNGICLESEYAYLSGQSKKAGECDEKKCVKDKLIAPQSYTDITPNSDSAMMSALAQQTVSVAIEADQRAFQLYKSGVFTAACGTSLDHGVLAVGYGTLDGLDYYKVKNSWGASWGDNGFILLQRGVSQPEGQCGILSAASYPNL
jgi:C1A family cysteine protease